MDEQKNKKTPRWTISASIVLTSALVLLQLALPKNAAGYQQPKARPVIQSSAPDYTAGREMLVLSTAYSSTGQPTKTGGYPVDNYTVAVDPQIIPLGSIVMIDGTAHDAADTGRLIKGYRIDRYYTDSTTVKDYGVKWVQITVEPPVEQGDR
jgi:3D (Asp-Asp-Asp) domain-containing protein